MTILRALFLLILLSAGAMDSARAETLSYGDVAQKAVLGISHTSISEAVKDDAFYMANVLGVAIILETLGLDPDDKTYGNGKISTQIRSLENKMHPILIETSTKKINAKINGFEDALKNEFSPDELPAIVEMLKTPWNDRSQTPLSEKLKALSIKVGDKAEIEYLSDLLPLLKQNGFKIPKKLEDYLSKVKAP